METSPFVQTTFSTCAFHLLPARVTMVMISPGATVLEVRAPQVPFLSFVGVAGIVSVSVFVMFAPFSGVVVVACYSSNMPELHFTHKQNR